jgi:hypothetical protein
MLFCALEAIRASEPTIALHVWPDRASDEAEICERFNAVQHKTIAHSMHGNSFNMLEALKWAYKHQYETVFVVEDDAVVEPSFFEWCRQALTDPTIFAACGWQFSPDAPPPSDGPNIKMPWYLSVAAAIPRRSLYGIVQHAKPEYYTDMQGYLDMAYPQSHRKNSLHYEQDGLVLRVCESEGKRCAWPRRPRATHVGWRGYHMPDGSELNGTLEDRVKIIKLLLKNPAMLRSMLNGGISPDVAYCDNCRTPLLSSDKSAKVVCVSCFHLAHPHLACTASSHYYLPA